LISCERTTSFDFDRSCNPLKRLASCKVSDELWEQRVKPLVPKRQRDATKPYKRKSGGGKKPKDQRKIFEGIFYVLLPNGLPPWKAIPALLN
jgi:hypothetical protein